MSLKNTKLISVDRIFQRLKGTMPLDEEQDIVEWIGDALEAIGVVTQYQETVCFLGVKNYTAELPKYCHAVIQLARNKFADMNSPETLVSPKLVTETYVDDVNDMQPSIPVALDENGTPINEYGLAYYRPFMDLHYWYNSWKSSSLYQAFTPIRLTENVFFNQKVCREKDHDIIYQNCEDEYNIILGETLKFSFPEGQVAIAYLKQEVDKETGYPLIPDQISYVTAIVNYCRWKWYEREFYAGREGAEKKMYTAEGQWIWYCGQAKNFALMLSGVDEHQNLLDQRSYVLPPKARYFNYFNNLNKPERRFRTR